MERTYSKIRALYTSRSQFSRGIRVLPLACSGAVRHLNYLSSYAEYSRILTYWYRIYIATLANHYTLSYMLYQGGGILIYSVLRSSSSVKVLTEYFLSWHYIYFTIVGFIAEISLDLDHLDRIHQRDIMAWPLTMENISSWLLTYFDRGRRSEYRVYWNATPLYIL